MNHKYKYMWIKLKIGLYVKLKMVSFELLTPETMTGLGSTDNKIAKGKNGENAPHLEIREVLTNTTL